MSTNIRLLVLLFAAVKIVLHLAANHQYGFHADELYYIALSRHLQWGYLDNGPWVTFIGALSKFCFGSSLVAYRLLPTLASGATVAVVGFIVHYLNGRRLAIAVACIAMICSPAYLATSYFLQPIVFEHFFWSALALFLIRYRQTNARKFLYLAAIVFALGVLNKYTMLLYAAALLPAFFKIKHLKGPALLALFIITPNLVWQWHRNFPVFHYVGIVRAGTANPGLGEYLFQFLFFHGAGMAVWLAGLAYLLISANHRQYRFLAWAFLVVTLVFIVLNGKIYYGLGAFPVLFAAGGVCWEQMLLRRAKLWQYSLCSTLALTALIALPSVIPILPFKQMLLYFKLMHTHTNITAIFRWEDGKVHAIPQTYADMLGWDHLKNNPQLVNSNKVVYTDDYGVAGALSYYLPHLKIVSPNNSLAQWSPSDLDHVAFIYVGGRPGWQNNTIIIKERSPQLQQQYKGQRQSFIDD